jgi:site-specific DNA-methyltransferase (adenine-specific)
MKKPASPLISTKKLSDLTPDARNANKGTERGSAMIRDSLRNYGAGRSILLDKHGAIIAGNKTAENAGALGQQDVIIVETDGSQLVAVQRTDLDLKDPRARQLAIADNRSGQLSLLWDPDTLKSLAADGIDMSPFWSAGELEKLWPQNPLAGEEDAVPELLAVPKSKIGDLYTMGAHRLLCGDATKALDLGRLLGAQKAQAMWTDPPYGVNYVGKTKAAKIFQNDGADGLKALLDAAFSNVTLALEPGSPVYVAHPPGALNVTFGNAFLAAGWRLHQTLIWDKGTIVLGHSDYHFSHEPIFYGYTPGQGRFGRGGKGWYGTDSERSVLPFPKPRASENHPTMKPVGLVERCLINSTPRGGVVLDPFGGSGTTLIACEKIARCCFMLELDPAYVDVIVERWQNATGKKAVLERG